ncbi:MAG: hypothetical protein LBG60_13960 [Bifidobacteriaceae bacterium]|jgi:Arc/MetJ-type ribon-helix-helix transcriptional regulator|nr:hypothetical protein [Bifidobacteriaceae bacterium]
MTRKVRVTVTADATSLDAGRRAVQEGEYASLSEWVDAAMSRQARSDARIRALGAALAAYEAECGIITAADMAAQARADSAAAVVVRGQRRRAA